MVAFVDKLLSTTVDLIRSEVELKNCTLYGLSTVLGGSLSMHRICSGGEKMKWSIKELRGQKGSYCNYTKIK